MNPPELSWLAWAKTNGIFDAATAAGTVGAMIIATVALWMSIKTRRELRGAADPNFELEVLEDQPASPEWFRSTLKITNNHPTTIIIDAIQALSPKQAKLLAAVTNQITQTGESEPSARIPANAQRSLNLGAKVREAGGEIPGVYFQDMRARPGDSTHIRFLIYAPNARNKTIRFKLHMIVKGRRDTQYTYRLSSVLPPAR